ncbi:uncharacterized protein LOC134666353 [Cydia fagiglandana]|uniref:uncharacterized protein LOC134666353 n=1 Tax=Cydia fagiglandana TaxID=1458189 RepID=UPI002FEE28B8
MVPESGPLVTTSKRRVVYRRSTWAVHEFEVWSGELVCRVAALRMKGSMLLWLGGTIPELGELALGLPVSERGALATSLSDEKAGDGAAGLARRLALALQRPVWVAASLPFDRFSAPLIARGLVKEIKSRPDFFKEP